MKTYVLLLSERQIQILFYGLKCGIKMQGAFDPEIYDKMVSELEDLIQHLEQEFLKNSLKIETEEDEV